MKPKKLSGKVNLSLDRYENFVTMPIEKKIKLLKLMGVSEKGSTEQSNTATTWEDAS